MRQRSSLILILRHIQRDAAGLFDQSTRTTVEFRPHQRTCFADNPRKEKKEENTFSEEEDNTFSNEDEENRKEPNGAWNR